MNVPVYLDHHATTPLAPGVPDIMTRYLSTEFGNPSSGHLHGQAPRLAVATARAQPSCCAISATPTRHARRTRGRWN